MIEVKNLTKKFNSVKALDGISFSIGSGSLFGLVGSNGAGKSTFLRTLAGIYAPDGGEILIDGKSPFENSQVKSRLYFISDYPYFLPQSTLNDMADFYKRIYPNWSRKRYEELCGLFPINAKDKIGNMSKGMQRQAALICALAARPDYLLLDEIFDGLDPVMRQLLKRIVFDEVAQRDMTVIVASHNLRELEDFCDHIGLFHKGGVVFERDLDEMKLGINKVQAVLKPTPDIRDFAPLDIVKMEKHGSLVSLVVRGSKEEILEKINSFNPIFVEILPLTLEEVFISEMEVAGYDIDNILS
ncbi:ABC transporter ATP-binding protein [Caproiciproducens galactitolivorans]|uniref:ABC transporter ATP-binding protein YtrB n=1 Tax=Caproiciproducens galactitolivorans TaxID=642589 RepID=A0A4Z0XX33_9FIRM|nr:ABC transporter ATP-binding protein [Caproiciproducens galactitolivorans]QEY34777.1 ABC transporter ATP-binding protein [Caproiciproducens galactitolivorans]TGJ75974.1 ABC transporter ATP-binding protein YtrB [Caproiciproducens galactitolivorans]